VVASPLRAKTPHIRRRLTLATLLVVLSLAVPAAAAWAAKPPPPDPVTIQILNVSDWHGNVDPISSAGGAWNLAARWAEDREAYPTLTLAAGDDIGASPPLVSFFDEIPSIKAQRMMGIQVGALGNHNFDGGIAHLQQMIDLAAAPGTGTSGDAPGQPFRYVAANLRNLSANITGVDPVAYFNVGGLKVAVIGITNEEAPNLVLPGSFGTIEVTDGVAAANKFARIARRNGSNVVLVVTHKGMRAVAPTPAGELIDFANGLEPGLVDVVFGDHTDIQYSGIHNGVLVHENRSYGLTYARTLITARPGKGGGVTNRAVEFVTPSTGGLSSGNTSCGALAYCNQAIVDMLVPYRQALAELLDVPIGTTTEPYKRGGNIERRQEIPLGNLITDGMRWKYGTQLAFMNGGGIRSQLPSCGYTPADTTLNRANWNSTFTTILACSGGYGGTPPYAVVLGDARAVLSFANILNTRTVTGAQLWRALENGVSAIAADGTGADGRFPQVSGFKFSFRYDVPTGCSNPATVGQTDWTTCAISRIQSVALLDGTPIPDDGTTYTMTLPNFINLGGDGYYVFNDGVGASQGIDWIILAEYITHLENLDPTADPLGRITKCSGSCEP
jgi:5'-nucleotidase